MSTNLLTALPNTYLPQVFAGSVPGTALAPPSVTAANPDSSQLSPFARLISALQQLQQSNPAQYAKTTAQISANLQTAAQSDQAQENTVAAAQLTKLAADFSTASQTGNLPNLQDLSQAVSGTGGGHHHHGQHHATSAPEDSASSSTNDSTTPATAQLSTALQSYSAQSTQASQNASPDPGAIILQALSSAGISVR